VFPELTEERRKEIAKEVKKHGEDAKVAIRNIRRDAIDALKKHSKDEGVSEDEIKGLEEKNDILRKDNEDLAKKLSSIKSLFN
jgi:ribosome recycling factor